ncbi:MAG: hypothetical protein LBL91_02785 [Lachnospiraceae bacterium]|jgi:hypothetical protein|nr:hypothetical protein [Lachnospiraceae bacterium]
MDKTEIREKVYEVVETKKYDKRFLSFIERYFLSCVIIYNWTDSDIEKNLEEYTSKINSIRFINIGKERCKVDLENKFIFLDEKIRLNKSDEVINEYIYASFREQDKILNTNTYEAIKTQDNSKFIHEVRGNFKLYSSKLSKEKILLEVNTLIEQKSYDKKYVPFIKEYFLRSAKLYDWSRDELIKKVKNYKINVEKIEIGKLKKKCVQFKPEEKKIVINKNLLTYSNNVIIKNMFREQGNATDYTKFVTNTYENGLNVVESNCTNQIELHKYAEEVGANYLTGKVPFSNEMFTTCRVSENDRNDYNRKTAYVISMIVAAFNINEFEFARLKDKGRAIFDEFFLEKYSYMDVNKYLEEFQEIIAQIEAVPESAFSSKEVSSAYAKMYNLALEILEKRLSYEKSIDTNYTKERKIAEQYAKFKIVDSLMQAKRNLSLEWNVVKKEINDKKVLHEFAKISNLKQRKFKKHAYKKYKSVDTEFNNKELSKIVVEQFKFPLLGKILKLFEGKQEPKLLREATNPEIDCINEEEIESKLKELHKKEIIIPQREIFEFNKKISGKKIIQ